MNEFFIGVQGSDIVFLKPVPQRLSREKALVLAAWIVSLVDPEETDYRKAVAEVQG